MRPFSESEDFKDLNIGFALDESAPNAKPDEFFAFNGERTSRQIKVTCKGTPGHGSLLPDNTAGEKMHYIINKFMALRAEEKKKVPEDAILFGDVTSINLTQLEGGTQINVLPERLSASFDIRIAPDRDHQAFEDMINSWCEEAGEGVSFEYMVKNPEIKSTKIDENNLFWTAITKKLKEMGKTVHCVTCPGATDARWVRRQGIPAINITPVSNTPLAIHAHDERMQAEEYLKAIGVMEAMVQAAANV
ncbi:hypothetical protein NE865_03970 [Phthorimaea operculella]|nr:hypothetical protein NE865_03970 [Phthorimaea operculella]